MIVPSEQAEPCLAHTSRWRIAEQTLVVAERDPQTEFGKTVGDVLLAKVCR